MLHVAAFMEAVYQKVRDGDWYLGAPDIHDYVQWAQTQSGQVLVYKDMGEGESEPYPVNLSMVGQVHRAVFHIPP